MLMAQGQLITAVILQFLLVYTGVSSVHDDYIPVCDKSDYTLSDGDPPLPRLPDQYYLAAEATIKEFELSIFITEYLDEIGNRGRLESTARGQKTSSISDYNLRETFVFPNRRTGEDCTVSLLTTNTTDPLTRFVFGIVPGDNNTVHIGPPSYFFDIDNETSARYLGINETRGVPSYHWQSCTVNENSSWTIDYYFTDASLWMTSETGLVPVTIELFGDRLNPTSEDIIELEHYYTFVDFRSGPESVPDDVFMVPTGLICSGRIPGQSIPALPSFFTAGIEIVTSDNVWNFQEFYDFDHQLFRYDVFVSVPEYTGLFSGIQDFNIETLYYIRHLYETCYVESITYENSYFDATNGSDGRLHLRGLRELLYATDDRDFVYEGVTTARGLLVDVWIAQSPGEFPSFNGSTIVNATYQIYFTRPGQRVRSVTGITTDSTIWQTTFTGTSVSMGDDGSEIIEEVSSTGNFYSFSPSEPLLDVYDISTCLAESEFVRLSMLIPTGGRLANVTSLKQNIRAAITGYARSVGMPFRTPLQISSIRVRTSESNDITVHLHIANISRNATTQWKYSAQDLLDRMTNGLKDGDQLPFTISILNTTVYPLYVPNNNTTVLIESTSSSSGLSAGATAGISIATFVIGIIIGTVLGLILCLCCQKFNKTGSYGVSSHKPETGIYERQVDDVIETDLPNVSSDN